MAKHYLYTPLLPHEEADQAIRDIIAVARDAQIGSPLEVVVSSWRTLPHGALVFSDGLHRFGSDPQSVLRTLLALITRDNGILIGSCDLRVSSIHRAVLIDFMQALAGVSQIYRKSRIRAAFKRRREQGLPSGRSGVSGEIRQKILAESSGSVRDTAKRFGVSKSFVGQLRKKNRGAA